MDIGQALDQFRWRDSTRKATGTVLSRAHPATPSVPGTVDGRGCTPRFPHPGGNASGSFGVHPHRDECGPRAPTSRRQCQWGLLERMPLPCPMPGTEMASGRVCPREHGPRCPPSALFSFEVCEGLAKQVLKTLFSEVILQHSHCADL